MGKPKLRLRGDAEEGEADQAGAEDLPAINEESPRAGRVEILGGRIARKRERFVKVGDIENTMS
jgi:hypothetical protein